MTPAPADVTAADVTAASRLLRDGKVSATDLARAYLDRIAKLDGTLNCFVTVTEGLAVAAAVESDARRRAGRALGPLDGIPVALKDNIDVAGVPTTAGAASRRGAVARADAEVVSRLRAAGAVILGKLNLHEIALGGTTNNAHFGRTANPHRLDRIPGGSSGGSGAAVAAGLCAAALGTDTLGSVRLPAAYCGVAGLKATAGLVSTRGVVPLCWNLDQVGPLTRSVEDLAIVLAALAGYDPDDAESQAPPAPVTYDVPGAERVRGIAIGRPRNFDRSAIAPEVRDAWDRALAVLGTLSARVRDVDIPGYEPALVRRAALVVIEADGAVVYAEDLARRPESFSPEVRSMLEYGRDVRAERLVKAHRTLAVARAAARRALADVDVLVLPTAAEPAFPFTARAPDSQGDLTALASVAGLPAVSVPMGMSPDGLPLGLQIIGRPFAETDVLAVARAYEQAAAWDMRPPDDRGNPLAGQH